MGAPPCCGSSAVHHPIAFDSSVASAVVPAIYHGAYLAEVSVPCCIDIKLVYAMSMSFGCRGGVAKRFQGSSQQPLQFQMHHGTGKVAAVIITMIFGGTPVVRLTVLGLRGVPETIREAAIAYGASKWYLLRKVDLPLATPSILAGVNQTVMLSLAMVVVASLIGAKGLGQDVLEALQYANVGQGILAGVAILFVALILDRVVQGKKRV